jgi:hypothetical protein
VGVVEGWRRGWGAGVRQLQKDIKDHSKQRVKAYELANDTAHLQHERVSAARGSAEADSTHPTPNTKLALPPPTITHSHHMTPVNAHANA